MTKIKTIIDLKNISIADFALLLQIDALNLEQKTYSFIVPTKYLPNSTSFVSRLMKVKSRSSQSSSYVAISTSD